MMALDIKFHHIFPFHKVEMENVSEEYNKEDSKIVAKKITIGKRIL